MKSIKEFLKLNWVRVGIFFSLLFIIFMRQGDTVLLFPIRGLTFFTRKILDLVLPSPPSWLYSIINWVESLLMFVYLYILAHFIYLIITKIKRLIAKPIMNNTQPSKPDHKGKAIASVIFACISIIWPLLISYAQIGFLLALVGLILGILGLKSTKRIVAIIGIILSAISILLTSLFFV